MVCVALLLRHIHHFATPDDRNVQAINYSRQNSIILKYQHFKHMLQSFNYSKLCRWTLCTVLVVSSFFIILEKRNRMRTKNHRFNREKMKLNHFSALFWVFKKICLHNFNFELDSNFELLISFGQNTKFVFIAWKFQTLVEIQNSL